MLIVGETIHSDITGRTYTITWGSEKITQAEVGFAKTSDEGEAFFIKRLLNMKYPTDSSLGSPAMKERMKIKLDNYFRKYSSLYKRVTAGCGLDGACVPIEDFFRDGAFFYTVYRKIESSTLSIEEISSLSSPDKYKLLLRLVQGLLPLHTLGVIHGDLKPDNILIQKDGSEWRIRLIDMNDCYQSGDPNPPGEVIGTLDYYSPELTDYNTYEIEDPEDEKEIEHVQRLAKRLTPKSDVFALGIIFCEFFTGSRPIITNTDIDNIADAAKEGCLKLPSTLSTSFAGLLNEMLSPIYDNRPGLTAIADKIKAIEKECRIVSAPIISVTKERNSANVEIKSPAGNRIHYTTDGSIPTNRSRVYVNILKIDKSTTIKAICISDDGRKSTITQENVSVGRLAFRINSKEPIINIEGKIVTITKHSDSSIGTEIFYTTDGSKPSISSLKYHCPFVVDNEVSCVSAVAKEPEENKMLSRIVSVKVSLCRLSKPIFHYSKGEVSIESKEGGIIHYTTDNTEPTVDSPIYTGSFFVEDKSHFTVRAIVVKKGFLQSEESIIKKPTLIMTT